MKAHEKGLYQFHHIKSDLTIWVYCYMVSNMKTTIDLPDDLLIQAKIHAARQRKTLKEIIVAGLHRELRDETQGEAPKRGPIRWVTVPGGIPRGTDVSDRETLHHLLHRTL